MVYGNCPMFSGYGAGFYLNWILVAVIFSATIWLGYYLLIKSKEIKINR